MGDRAVFDAVADGKAEVDGSGGDGGVEGGGFQAFEAFRGFDDDLGGVLFFGEVEGWGGVGLKIRQILTEHDGSGFHVQF